jgi:type VI secretion system protein ImpA
VRGLDGGDRAGTLIWPIQMIPLISGSGQPEISLQQFAEEPDGDAVKAALSGMKPAAAVELAATAVACSDEFTSLREAMMKHCGESAPPTRNIQEAIQQVLSAAKSIQAKVAPPAAGETATDGGAAGESVSTSGNAGVAISGPIKSRSQALAMLDAVAVFFKTHDPHSFVAYGAAEVARWGRMPLHELLGDLLQGQDGAREVLSRRLGVIVQEAKKPDG